MTLPPTRLLRTGILALVFCALGAVALRAHPHIWIDSTATFEFKDQHVTAVRLVWEFDPLFSSAVIQDFDINRNGQIDEEELPAIERDAFSNLKEFNYFTYIRVDGEAIKIAGVEKFSARVKDDLLVYAFTVPLPEPVAPTTTKLSVSVYDESYYVYLGPNKDDPVRFAGVANGACQYRIAEDRENPIYYGVVFPLAITLTCPTS